jgi:hypothetical protein
MELTLEQFRLAFPEFEAMPDEQVQLRLDWAHRQCNASVWGDFRADGVGWLTAHFCAMGPGGRDMRLEQKVLKSSTPLSIYQVQYNQLVRKVAGGAWTTDNSSF